MEKLLEWADEGTLALNQMAGQGSAPKGDVPLAAVGASKSLSLQMPKPPDDLPSPEDALMQILKKAGLYEDRPDLAAYDRNLVSWPEAGNKPTELGSLLPEADRQKLYEWSNLLLRDPGKAAHILKDAGLKRPHYDPKLFKSQKAYIDFLKQLESRGLL